jgi:hypothetical protein
MRIFASTIIASTYFLTPPFQALVIIFIVVVITTAATATATCS